MGQLLGMGIGLLGAGLGANQKTGGETTTKNLNTTSMPIEPGYFSDFRKSLVNPYNNYLAQAQKPVYGQGQDAQFLNQSNNLTNSAMSNLASTLATRTGSLNNGAFSKGAADILMNRQSNVANYNMMTPLLNQQAVMQNMHAALGLGTGWAGAAPLGHSTQETGTSTTNKTSGSFLNSLASMLGSGAGNSIGKNPSGGGPFSQNNIAQALGMPSLYPAGQGIPGLGQDYGPPTPTSVDSTFNPGSPVPDPNGGMSGMDWQNYFGYDPGSQFGNSNNSLVGMNPGGGYGPSFDYNNYYGDPYESGYMY